MRRVHRTLMERFNYLAIYSCKECHAEDNLPRAHQLHRGKAARCPKCGTYRLTKLKEPDHIDPFQTGVLNIVERLVGGRLFHCRYCRVQFWDRRRLQSELIAEAAAAAPERSPRPCPSLKRRPPIRTAKTRE
jgi:DNA-directed RNA polymerase subunit RPC12/RpoP